MGVDLARPYVNTCFATSLKICFNLYPHPTLIRDLQIFFGAIGDRYYRLGVCHELSFGGGFFFVSLGSGFIKARYFESSHE